MNFKQRYQTIQRSSKISYTISKYQDLLEDDVADYIQLLEQKKNALNNEINAIFSKKFIKVNSGKNKNDRIVHNYSGHKVQNSLGLEGKIDYFGKNESYIFVETPEKIYDRFIQDDASARWFPTKSAEVFDAIIAKEGYNQSEILNTHAFYGVDVKDLAAKMGFDNPKIYNYTDYVSVGRTKTKAATTFIDEAKLFNEGQKSAKDILAEKGKKIIFIMRNRDLYNSNAEVATQKTSVTDTLNKIEKVLGVEFDHTYIIGYGDWKKLKSKSKIAAKLPVWDNYIKKHTTVSKLAQLYNDAYTSSYEGIPGFLSYVQNLERIEEYGNSNNYKSSYAKLNEQQKAKVDEFWEDFAICKKATKNDVWAEKRNRERIRWVAYQAFKTRLEDPTEQKKIETNFEKKYGWTTILDSYDTRTHLSFFFNMVANYNKTF